MRAVKIMEPIKIYIASSWRNKYQPSLVTHLRDKFGDNILIYDFRNPAPGNYGFQWRECDGGWESWSTEKYIEILEHSDVAAKGFKLDKDALDWCELCVMVMPAGRSASLELGYAAGAGKVTFVYIPERCEPELMFKLCDKVVATEFDLDNAIIDLIMLRKAGKWEPSAVRYYDTDSAYSRRLIGKPALNRAYGKFAEPSATIYTGGAVDALKHRCEGMICRADIGTVQCAPNIGQAHSIYCSCHDAPVR
jgi:hypothetical protein